MKTRWLLHACIVLAVGVGLVSCSKDEINQVMNRPAEIILSSSPCQPAGVASTVTPEFCVNVTDIQLLSRDTEADVSLTLVNRTGRRLFLALSSPPYLTDSSGAKWDRRTSTGIGFISPSNVPVPLEPNVETQVSFLFYHHGQAPTDLTFSMRGEIAIMKVDSRGQANPLQIGVKRGFNLSGIRTKQQPPQSSAPTNQNPSIEFTQLAPLDVGLAAPRTEEPDILGIRLGMSPDEARLILKKQGFSLQPSDVSEATIEGLPNSRHIASMATFSGIPARTIFLTAVRRRSSGILPSQTSRFFFSSINIRPSPTASQALPQERFNL